LDHFFASLEALDELEEPEESEEDELAAGFESFEPSPFFALPELSVLPGELEPLPRA
jgi:hypothetical protein